MDAQVRTVVKAGVVVCLGFSLFLLGCTGNTSLPTIAPLAASGAPPPSCPLTVSISDATAGATIYYGINRPATIVYTGPFQVPQQGPVTLAAYATSPGNLQSGVATANFCSAPAPPNAPTFTQVSAAAGCGTVLSQINVANAPLNTIVYGTLDDTPPSPTNNWWGVFPGTTMPFNPVPDICVTGVRGNKNPTCVQLGVLIRAVACLANTCSTQTIQRYFCSGPACGGACPFPNPPN
jgi:hypothetical protein